MDSDLGDIPNYAKAWGLKVKRAKNLPKNYDNRIPKEFIFVFLDNRKEEKFVVLKSCKKCKYSKQACNSAYPICDRCERTGSKCEFNDLSWKPLPKTKQIRDVNRAESEVRHSSWEDIGIDTITPGNDSPRHYRIPRKAHIPSYALLITQSLNFDELESPCGGDDTEFASGSTPKALKTRQKGRMRKQMTEDGDLEAPEQTQINDRVELVDGYLTPSPSPKKLKKIEHTRGINSSNANSKKLQTLGSGKKRAQKQMLNGDDDDDDDVLGDDLEDYPRQNKKIKTEKGKRSLIWTSAQPDISSRLSPRKHRNKLDAMPRIWCSSYNDLTSALPELSHLTNGICLFNRDVPTILLDGHAWHDDVWDGRTLEITLARNLVCPEDYEDKFWENLTGTETNSPSSLKEENIADSALSSESDNSKPMSPSIEIPQSDGGETYFQILSPALLSTPLSNSESQIVDEVTNPHVPDISSTGPVSIAPNLSSEKRESFAFTQVPTPPSSCKSSPNSSEKQQSISRSISISLDDFSCLPNNENPNTQRRMSTPVSTPARIPTPPLTPTHVHHLDHDDPMDNFVEEFLRVSNLAYFVSHDDPEDDNNGLIDNYTNAARPEEIISDSPEARNSDLVEPAIAAEQSIPISVDNVNSMEPYELKDEEVPPPMATTSHIEAEFHLVETAEETIASPTCELTTSTSIERTNQPNASSYDDNTDAVIDQSEARGLDLDLSTATISQPIDSSSSTTNDINSNQPDEESFTPSRSTAGHLAEISGERKDCHFDPILNENIVPKNGMTESKVPIQNIKHLEKYPEDIRSLYDAVDHGMPTSIIVSSSWALLPFLMQKDVQIAFLGFFHVTRILTSTTPFVKVQRKGLNYLKGQLRWRIRLEWVEGGEPPSTVPSISPFWSTSPTSTHHPPGISNASASAPLIDPKEIGLSLLPQYLYANESQWWHCTDCGKLNLTGWMGKHLCTFCLSQQSTHNTNNSIGTMPVLEADDVRDCLRCSPNMHPDIRCSDNVYKQMIYWPTGIRTFIYCTGEERNLKVLKYIYTCNLPSLEGECNTLFKSFQTNVDMQLKQRMDKSDPGAQYTYSVVPDDHVTRKDIFRPGTSTWKKAPSTLLKTRQFMIKCAHDYIRPKTPIENFSFCDVIAWRYSKAKEVKTIRAQSSSYPVFLLCLGADIDLHINRISHKGQKIVDHEAMDVDSISGENHAIKRSPETKTTELSVQISLSHGSMIIISGCELEYKVSAKEFSILIKGYYHSSQLR